MYPKGQIQDKGDGMWIFVSIIVQIKNFHKIIYYTIFNLLQVFP